MLQATSAAPTRHLSTCGTWTQRVGPLTGLPALIRELDGDPASILAEAGLAPDALDDPNRRVPYAALVRLLRAAASRTDCHHLGLLAGRMWHVSDLGLVGELVRNCATVGDALETLTVYQHLNSGGGLAFLIEHGATVDLGYAIYHPDVTGTEQMYDCVLAGALNFLRELCGPAWMPSEVLFPHAAAHDRSPYRRLFKSAVHFDAEFAAIRFPRAWLDHPIEGRDCARHRLALQRANAIGGDELIPQVFRALRTLLLHGKDSGDDVASMLSMHRRTLNRRLRAEGTTFRELLDQVRFDVARQLLGDSDISLDDIAATLGYAGVSPFMRTFRRWAGTTPARWRRTMAADRALPDRSPARQPRHQTATESVLVAP